MLKTLIDQKTQRTLIGKLRKAAEVRGFTFEHERIRKTKTRAESNTYRLKAGSTILVEIETGALGLVRWARDLRSAVIG